MAMAPSSGLPQAPMFPSQPSLPSPPADENAKQATASRRSFSVSTTPTPLSKQHHSQKVVMGRVAKRASTSSIGTATMLHHDSLAHGVATDGRQKRVWKACERCRMKKTKASLSISTTTWPFA
ncbi:hypothetical protein CDD82_7200 [Ophiocordyceps australis]|uniref:Uncharacterized protein n=1 Tax=Ophiocordyceps australis TaxID=1399860 RepID=A0A2C5ZQE2_9HYPO|nr:hypothetical protein CDD82_7200 [Ophiocordyceps australis]